MEDPNGEVMLYCLGCGGPVCRANWQGRTLSISCRCGAGAPLLYNLTARITAMPTSLGLALVKGRTPPHLEYHLGYSDHDSPEKRDAMELLLIRGYTSQATCSRRKCREAFRRGKAQWAEHQERAQRIAQIGEP